MKLQALTWRSLPWIKASRPQWRYALRNGIAMCLALSVAYWLNLDEPYWAMTSAAVVSFPTVGGVISKSLGRIAGSLLGATAALIIAGHTLNDPWLFLLSMAIWLGFCTWACAHFTNNVAYAFQLAGYTAAIIAFPVVNVLDTTELWDIAQARVCEVIVGILSGGFMMMILPSTSDGTALITALKTMHTRLLEHASLLWQPDTDTSLLLRAYLQKDPSGGYHGSLPLDGTRYAHNGRKLSPSTNEGDPGDGYQRRQQIYSYEFDHQFTDVWSVYSAGSYTHTNVSLDQVYQVGWIDDSDMLARGYSGSRGSLDGWSTDNRLRADFNTGDLAHTLILGAEYHRFRNDLWTGAGGAAPLNPFSGYTAQTGHTVTYSDDNNRRYYQTGLYLQDEMVWNRWHVDVSARYDRIVSQQVSDTQGTSNRRSDDHISGRASLLYALDNGLSPYLSYSQAITPAMLPGADGKPLKPTTAEQVEAGLKFQPPGSSDLYSIAIYDLTQKDVATRDPNIATATYIPAGKVHSQGVELEAHHQITPQLSTIASYTWNRLRFQDTKDGTDNNTPQLTPDQMASFWARYQFPAGISVGAGVRYIGKQWADDANTARLPSVTLMDAMMRADLGVWSPTLKGAYVQVNANNIGDREYISGCYGTGNCYWGAERSVIATVGYDF